MAIFTLLPMVLFPAGGFLGGGALTIFGLSAQATAAIFSVGRSILWSLVASALTRPKLPKQQVQAQLNESASPRIRSYGLNMLGGVRALWEAEGGTLHQIVVAHQGPLNALKYWVVDGDKVTVDTSGEVTDGSAKGAMKLQAILSGNGGNYSAARAALPEIWTTDHKLIDLATYYARMEMPDPEDYAKKFPNGAYTKIAMVVEGSKVKDPRDGVVKYVNHGAACIMDYLTHADGLRVPASRIDTASFAAKTVRDAQTVPLKAGGTERRYPVNGYYTLEDAPKDVLGRLMHASDAVLYQTPEGKIGIIGGAWSEPDVTITEDDILEHRLVSGTDPFSDFNVLKGVYTSPLHKFQDQECEEWRDEVSLDTQPERVETFEVEYCQSPSQMRRLMKIYRARALREWEGTITTNLVGLKARFPKGDGIHTIRVRLPEMGLNDVFEVTSHTYNIADKTCTIGIASIWNAWAWDPNTEEGDPPPPLDTLKKVDTTIPPPANLELAQQVVTVSALTNGVRIIATVNNPQRLGLRLQIRFRKAGGTEAWQAIVAPAGVYTAVTPLLDDNARYEVQAGWVGRTSATPGDTAGWSDTVTIDTLANPEVPFPPGNFKVTAGAAARQVDLSWSTPNSNYAKTRIFRATQNSFSAASAIATYGGASGMKIEKTDTVPAAGTYWYWAVTLNDSLVASSPAPSTPASIVRT